MRPPHWLNRVLVCAASIGILGLPGCTQRHEGKVVEARDQLPEVTIAVENPPQHQKGIEVGSHPKEVQVVKPERGVVQSPSGRDEIHRSLVAIRRQSYQDDVRKTVGDMGTKLTQAEVIAWAVKVDDSASTPPWLWEEVIVLPTWTTWNGKESWTLQFLHRLVSSPTSWKVYSSEPALTASRDFATRPTDEEISQFIHETNFGYNECYPYLSLLSVKSYRDSAVILGTLRAGISPQEKQRRKNRLDGQFGEPY